ncbi:hypothetical protein CPB83DRAFT_846268 [Crepidotus variabilis]|uniref:Uncharacterized protein n=1 Tax=Crepidotus variabilis TaxID=179855 RepID=A0A9P6EN03_9AGAR|nr:hypothetical protein CPB83DRAFT_846268 [Crepidotus variabilis]
MLEALNGALSRKRISFASKIRRHSFSSIPVAFDSSGIFMPYGPMSSNALTTRGSILTKASSTIPFHISRHSW